MDHPRTDNERPSTAITIQCSYTVHSGHMTLKHHRVSRPTPPKIRCGLWRLRALRNLRG